MLTAKYFRKMIKRNKRAQMEIQETAFVLLAVIVLAAMLFMLYARLTSSGLRQSASELQEQKAISQLAIISGMPELSCSETYSEFSKPTESAICIDEDKLLGFKQKASNYRWQGLSKIQVQRIYPSGTGECNLGNAEQRTCSTYTIFDTGKANVTISSFANLCRQEKQGYSCHVAKILVSTQAL